MGKENITIPFSVSKRFLISGGLRANPESVKLFETEFRKFGIGLAEAVGNITILKKRKTIFAEDFKSLTIITNFEVDEEEIDKLKGLKTKEDPDEEDSEDESDEDEEEPKD
jgi:hypothetical protein